MSTNVFELFAKIGLDDTAFRAGLDSAKGAMSSFGGAITSGAKKIASIGVKAVGVATTAITAFGTSSVMVGKEFDKSMSQVAATMGKTTGEIQNLRDFAQEMGRTTAFSATQAADALNYMALAGYDAETSMEMLPNVLNLAAAGGMDLARASDMVTDTQTAFGISLERTSQMVDEMAKAASTGNTNVEQLGDAFLTVGGLAKELNGGFVKTAGGANLFVDGVQELEIALTAMANAGIKGSEAGTHMRNMLLKLSSPTDAGTKALEAMGVQIFDTEGQMRSLKDIMVDLNGALGEMTQGDKIQVISELFNTRDMAAAEALLASVEQDWDKIGESILDSGLSLDVAKQAIVESGLALNGMSVNVEKLAGDIRMDLTTANMSVEETAQDIAEAYNISMDEAMQAVSAVSGALNQAKGAADKMAATQLDNLAGDVTLFKSALEGAQIAVSDALTPALREFVQLGSEGLQRITEGFKSGGIEGAMEQFGVYLSKGLNMIVEGLPGAINAGMKLVGSIGDGIIKNIPTITKAAVQIGVQMVQGLVKAIPDIVKGTKTLISSLKTELKNNSASLIEAGKELLTLLYDGIIKGIPQMAASAVDIIQSLGQGIMANMDTVLDGAQQILLGLANGIITALPTLIETSGAVITQFIQGITERLPELMAKSTEILKYLVEGITKELPQMMKAATDALNEFIKGLTTAMPDLVTAAVDIISTLASGIGEALPTLIPSAVEAIREFVMGLLDNLPELIHAALELMKGFAQGVIDAIPEITTHLPEIIEALVTGLLEGLPEILSVGLQLVGELIGGLLQAAADLIKAGAELVWDFVWGIGNHIVDVWNAAGEMVEAVAEQLSSLPEKAIKWGSDLVKSFIDGVIGNKDKINATIQEMAASIDGYIGFSEPEVGPLSDFHTYAPDMMKLFADGIMQNQGIVITAIQNFALSMKEAFDTSIEAIDVTFRELPNMIARVFEDVLSKVQDFAQKMSQSAREIGRGFSNGILDSLTSLPGQMTDIGTRIVDGLSRGIQNGWGGLLDMMRGLSRQLIETTKNEFDIHSPSQVFRNIGNMIDEGFRLGIEDGSEDIANAMTDILTVPNVSYAAAESSGYTGGFVQNLTINSPRELDPSETARLNRNASREMYLALRMG